MKWTGRMLFLLVQILLTCGLGTGENLKPQNLSVEWLDDFHPRLTWASPAGAGRDYTYAVSRCIGSDCNNENLSSPSWNDHVIMDGGSIHFAVSTIFPDGRKSEPAVLNVSYPDMVRNVRCSIISSAEVRCSWEAASPQTPLHFFYLLNCENQRRCGDAPAPALQECSSYIVADGNVRSGCTVQADVSHNLLILFNGTAQGAPFRNTFRSLPQDHVQPPGFNWTISKTNGTLNISWSSPNITKWLHKFQINYTECKENKQEDVQKSNRTAKLKAYPDCRYRVKMRAVYQRFGAEFFTPWTPEETFEAETDPNAWVYPVVLVPLVFAALLAVSIVCCRKHRANIFPEIPKPRDLLSDISNNNNKSTAYDLCSPYEEEEKLCDITLVVDPKMGETKLEVPR